MANYRIVTSFINYTPTATAEDSAFPATNLNSYQFHPFRPWKASSNAGTVDLSFDVGTGNLLSNLSPDPVIFLDVCNVTTIRIQANGSLSWGSPPWSATLVIRRNPLSDRTRGFFRLTDLVSSAVAYRYVNCRIDSQNPSSGYQYQIGTALFGTIQEFLANPLYPARNGITEPRKVNEFTDGGKEVLKMGPMKYRLSLDVQAVGSSELDQNLAFGQLGESHPFILWDSVASATQYAYLMRQSGEREFTASVFDQYVGTWVMEEVL